jgi:hypothetical protein
MELFIFAPDSFILNSKPVYPGALTDPGGDLTDINVRLRGLTPKTYFTLLQSRSMKTLSIQRPRPSMLIFTPRSNRRPVHSAEVN